MEGYRRLCWWLLRTLSRGFLSPRQVSEVKAWGPGPGQDQAHLTVFETLHRQGLHWGRWVMYIQWLCQHYTSSEAYRCFRDIKDRYARDLPSLIGLVLRSVVWTLLRRHPPQDGCCSEE